MAAFTVKISDRRGRRPVLVTVVCRTWAAAAISAVARAGIAKPLSVAVLPRSKEAV